MCAYILLVQMTTIVAMAAAVMAMLLVSIVAVSTIFAVTDNNNTDTTAEAGEARAKLKILAGKELPTIDGAKTTGDG